MLDADCPIWDHVVQLFVCCEDAEGSTRHCDQCDATPWMAMAATGDHLPVKLPDLLLQERHRHMVCLLSYQRWCQCYKGSCWPCSEPADPVVATYRPSRTAVVGREW